MNYVFWFRFAGTCGIGSLTALAGSRIAPSTWNVFAYLLCAIVAVAMVVVGLRLFRGWRLTLPSMPAVPVGYASDVRRYSSEQLRQVDAEQAQHEAAVVDWLSGYYRKA